MKHPAKTFESGQPMDIPCEIVGEYLRFRDEMDADEYCIVFWITAPRYCVNGYMNGLRLDEINTVG